LKTIYIETSALLSWLLGEPVSAEVKSRINNAGTVATSTLTLLETERALIRGEIQGMLSAGDAEKLRGLLARARSGWVLMEITEEVRTRASRFFPVEPLRTLDAIHLATALVFTRVFPTLELLSYDSRILRNVAALGIPTTIASPA